MCRLTSNGPVESNAAMHGGGLSRKNVDVAFGLVGDRRFLVRVPAGQQRAAVRGDRNCLARPIGLAGKSPSRHLEPGAARSDHDSNVILGERGFNEHIAARSQSVAQHNDRIADAILVSAGGDDIVGDQFVIYLDYGGGGLNAARFQGVLNSVQASYGHLS